jgi:hypothetical protein
MKIYPTSVALSLACLLMSFYGGAVQAAGESPITNNSPAEQAAPGESTMSVDTCNALIKQNDGLWENYRTWALYRTDRNAHWYRDGIFQATANLKHFVNGLKFEERTAINSFLDGTEGTVQSITQDLDKMNSRLSRLEADVVRAGAPIDPAEGDLSEHYRISFKITNDPRSITMLAGGRPRFDFNYSEMKETEKRYPPMRVSLGRAADGELNALESQKSTPAGGRPEDVPNGERLKELNLIDKAATDKIAQTIALTPADSPHFADKKTFMIGQKIVPAKCFDIPKPVVEDKSVNTRSEYAERDWELFWMRYDRPIHYHSSSGRSPH